MYPGALSLVSIYKILRSNANSPVASLGSCRADPLFYRSIISINQAGIVPRMLTGDHPSTAKSISLAVGILNENSPKGAVMTGKDFDALSEDEIDALPELPLVIARCAPETKVRFVRACQVCCSFARWNRVDLHSLSFIPFILFFITIGLGQDG